MRRLSTDKRKAVLPGDPTTSYPFDLPYGYEPVGGALVPSEDARATVRLIFGEALEAASLDQIVQSLQAEHRPAPSGAEQWDAEHVASILRDPVYMGQWRGFGRVEAIVEPSEWESAQKRLPQLAS